MSSSDTNWWMFHGDPAHTGFVSGSEIDSTNVGKLSTLHELEVGGPILSVPAVADGFVYVGTANGTQRAGKPSANGGSLHKIDLESGETVASFHWSATPFEGDAHGFTGMGCTPAVTGGRVYFSGFNGKLYCLDAGTLERIWCVNLREADRAYGQPVTNTFGVESGLPQAEGWSSPLVVNGRVYVGIGEGENPQLYAFVFCLDAMTGQVLWIFCTNQFVQGVPNRPNVLPAAAVEGALPPGYSVEVRPPIAMGCSVWTAIAYDADLDQIYCATGNPQPQDEGLPGPGYSYGILSLDAGTGAFRGFFQPPKESSYRASDIDVDFGGSPVIFEMDGRKVVCAACKNGSIFIVDAITMTLIAQRQMLPHYNNGDQIPTVDPHGPDDGSDPNPRVSNAESNSRPAENFYGGYSTPALHPDSKRLFVGVGGNNYHSLAAGIDYETTPFMRALNWADLRDAWAVDEHDPRRYVVPVPPMYTTPAEAGLSSPAVVGDVVFCSTSKVSLYAFAVHDGRLLWSDDLGMQTGGFNGGYGYCLGPAIWGKYVVAGALVFGRDGGVLKIYTLSE